MASFPRRYNVYIADLNPTLGNEISKVRRVVVVSRDEMNRLLGTVVICPLTSRLHPRWRGRLQVKCVGQDAEIAVDQIRTISKERLGRRIDDLTADNAAKLRRIISEMYAE